MKVYFDMDGVIRLLPFYNSKTWDQDICGLSPFDFLDQNRHVLEEAPKTKYCDMIAKYCPTIITCQPKEWRPYTMRWLAKNMPCIDGLIFVNQINDKFKHMKASDWLVEDCPHLKDYSHVVIVDYPYNQEVKPAMRVRTVDELDRFLRRHHERDPKLN